MPETEARDAIVIGAGIVGICATLALQDKGFDVTVIDREGPAEATSYGNAGVISPWSCVPQSMPGLWKQVPKWLLDPEGPLSIRWSYAPRMLPWLIEFLRAGTPSRLPAIADAMLAVNRSSVELYRQLLADTGEDALVRDCLYLHLYRDPKGADPDALPWRLRRERGVPLEVLKGGEIQELEPEVSSAFQSAVAIRQQGRTVNPGRLGKVLAAKAEARGARFLRARVTRIAGRDGPGYRVETDEGSHEANKVVLAAGAWSKRLLADLGVRLPLEAERGYHLVFTDPGLTLSRAPWRWACAALAPRSSRASTRRRTIAAPGYSYVIPGRCCRISTPRIAKNGWGRAPRRRTRSPTSARSRGTRISSPASATDTSVSPVHQ